MVPNFGQNQSVRLEPGSGGADELPLRGSGGRAEFKPPRTGRYTLIALFFALIASAFWIGVSAAYLWGYFGLQGLREMGMVQRAVFAAGILFPPLLFFGVAAAFALAHRMGKMAESLQGAAEQLYAIDEGAARTAARLGRAVRHELDALNSGLDGAFGRLRALEGTLEKQIAALDEAGARTEVRGETIASRLTQESERLAAVSDQMSDAASRAAETVASRLTQEREHLASVSDQLSEAASRAAETVAGRSAQLKSTIETAEGSLKMAAQSLDVQAAGFRAAVQSAAEAPHTMAVKLDEQAKKIETASDAALGRAEFVLARQEKHRTALAELLEKLKEEGARFEESLSGQCKGLESAIGSLEGEAKRFESVTGDAERHLGTIMENTASRANELATAFAREAERLKETSEASDTLLSGLVANLREAGTSAQDLIGDSAAKARQGAENLVNQAMAENERLLRAAGEMGAEAGRLRELLDRTAENVERHLARLPTLAEGEAQRIRQMVQAETDQMLDLSARMLSTIHARTAHTDRVQTAQAANDAGEGDGLKGLARRLTQRSKRGAEPKSGGDNKNWEMRELLAAVESGESVPHEIGGGTAAAIGALQLALADMAVDLEAIDTHSASGNEDWRRYLSGDRAVFARRLAGAIDEGAVDRITALYRDDARFHEAAEAYLSEFENLLAKAREGDGGGLLTSSLLSADTGKIYLAVAYALGRL